MGVVFIPFAMETYGKMGKEALRMLRTLQQDQADSTPPSALRPWHARSFVDSAVQRLSVALQRSIQRGQILRSHLRRCHERRCESADSACVQWVRAR